MFLCCEMIFLASTLQDPTHRTYKVWQFLGEAFVAKAAQEHAVLGIPWCAVAACAACSGGDPIATGQEGTQSPMQRVWTARGRGAVGMGHGLLPAPAALLQRGGCSCTETMTLRWRLPCINGCASKREHEPGSQGCFQSVALGASSRQPCTGSHRTGPGDCWGQPAHGCWDRQTMMAQPWCCWWQNGVKTDCITQRLSLKL